MNNQAILTSAGGVDILPQNFVDMKNMQSEGGLNPLNKFCCANCGSNTYFTTVAFESEAVLESCMHFRCGLKNRTGFIDVMKRRRVNRLEKLITQLKDNHQLDDQKLRHSHFEVKTKSTEYKIDCDVCTDVMCDDCPYYTIDHKNYECPMVGGYGPELHTESESLKEIHIRKIHKIEVRCCSCYREIEFGWSKSNIHERANILPCESTDFNPGACLAEPRFLKNWQKRGWADPNRRKSNVEKIRLRYFTEKLLGKIEQPEYREWIESSPYSISLRYIWDKKRQTTVET
jgi:hypothetical protein